MRYFTALRSVQYDNFALRVILSKAKNPFIRRMRYFTALRSVQYDNFAVCVILSEAKNLFIRRMRYFTALRSVQYDNFAECVILSVAKNLKKNADTTSFRTVGDSPYLQSLERQGPQLYYSRKSFSF